MKIKIFLVILVLILTIANFIIFKDFYETKVNNNETKQIESLE